ncbi:IS66 family insertion sequence element accessory protein TnpB [Vibrio metschnikovii]|nr:IS66 family insertion sequence element accessory protein TnpB [Vibrio metschnikovii]
MADSEFPSKHEFRLVRKSFCPGSFSEAWFIFCNRGRDKIKILFWDTNVFWLYYRR